MMIFLLDIECLRALSALKGARFRRNTGVSRKSPAVRARFDRLCGGLRK